MATTMAQATGARLVAQFWATAPLDDKIQAVCNVVTNSWRSTVSIARELDISSVTATKYLHLAVQRGLLVADPVLTITKTGSTSRKYKRAPGAIAG